MSPLVSCALILSLVAASAPGVVQPKADPFEQGILLYERGKYAESIPYLEKALNRYPEGSNILWNLGLASAAAGQHEKALTYWQRYRQLRSNDWRAVPKLIQTYQALGRIDKREETLADLFNLRKQTQDPQFKEIEIFCREQFKVGGRVVLAYQFFEPSGDWMQFYRFSVMSPKGKEEYYISLGSYQMTNQISKELGDVKEGERLYHYDGYYPDGLHRTFGFLDGKTTPTYDEIRPTVLKILEGEIKPASSSKFK